MTWNFYSKYHLDFIQQTLRINLDLGMELKF